MSSRVVRQAAEGLAQKLFNWERLIEEHSAVLRADPNHRLPSRRVKFVSQAMFFCKGTITLSAEADYDAHLAMKKIKATLQYYVVEFTSMLSS
ncbi:hypothetical protein B0H17DRAFT_1193625 [Mycena rosella]|uniref:Uncharacterized protein n=1 Tax=Mycena rosella TaxID=1033263 RepID=A0AAD7GSN6_MYCRO|nr:hypothetical protein B0H17DRAFT_1193625 [Mycena rosella]